MRYTALDKIGEILAEDVELFSLLNARRRKNIGNPSSQDG